MKINPNRVDLVKEIPLDRPLSINFETTSRCNFACTFCPCSDGDTRARVGFTRQDMPNELFMKIIDDLKEFPRKIKVNHYHYMGEPLLNPNFFSLVRYAVDANVAEEHWIRTNGSLLNKQTVKNLVDCGLTRIGVSVEAVNEAGYRDLVKRRGMFEKVVQGVSELYEQSRGKCKVYAKIINFGLPATDPDAFNKIFAPITDECDIEYPMQWNHGVPDSTMGRGIKVTVNGDELNKHIACPYPFFTMVVNSKGKALMCCFDWSYQTAIGDVTKSSMKEIWNGQEVRDFWKMHLRGERGNNLACRDCLNLYACPDRLDNNRDELLARLNALEN
jgi:radical SAM protein with 4Fe4S-binding SPASM domain